MMFNIFNIIFLEHQTLRVHLNVILSWKALTSVTSVLFDFKAILLEQSLVISLLAEITISSEFFPPS